MAASDMLLSIWTPLVDRLEAIEKQVASIRGMLSEIYRSLYGNDYGEAAGTAPVPPPPPPPPSSSDSESPVPSLSPSRPSEPPPGVVPAPLPPEPLQPPQATTVLLPEEIFKMHYHGKRLGIIGGVYDDGQVKRLHDVLGVVVQPDTWLSGKKSKIRNRLQQWISNTKMDLLFIHTQVIGPNDFERAQRTAKCEQLRCVYGSSLNVCLVARLFLTQLGPAYDNRTPLVITGQESLVD